MSPASVSSIDSRLDVVVLDGVRHGLIDPVGGTRELDSALDTARRAEAAGAAAVVVPSSAHWPATAQALAVLLATSSVRVVVEMTDDDDPATFAGFAASATRLVGDRLVVAVHGRSAGPAAERLRRRWDGAVVVGEAGLAELVASTRATPRAPATGSDPARVAVA